MEEEEAYLPFLENDLVDDSNFSQEFNVPPYLLERSKQARDRMSGLGKAAAASSITSFLDMEASTCLGEVANGGVCALAVTNVIVELPNLQKDGTVTEFYEPVSRDFKLAGHNQTRTVREGFFKKHEVTEYIPESNNFQSASGIIALPTGIEVSLGFFRDDFGALVHDTHRKTQFIPLIEFNDMRHTPDDDPRCSYATFMSTLIPCEVQINEDEKQMIGEIDPTSGEIRVAKTVLDAVLELQETKSSGDVAANVSSAQKLYEMLQVNEVVASALGIDKDRDYRKEAQLRRIARCYTGMAIIYSENHDGPQGPATDWTESLKVNSVENESIVTVEVAYPNARENEPREVIKVELGERIGDMLVTKLPLLGDAVTDEIVLQRILEKFDAQNQTTDSSNFFLRGLEAMSAAQAEPIVMARIADYHIQHDRRFAELSESDAEAATNLIMTLATQYNYDPRDFVFVKMKKTVDSSKYALLYLGQFQNALTNPLLGADSRSVYAAPEEYAQRVVKKYRKSLDSSSRESTVYDIIAKNDYNYRVFDLRMAALRWVVESLPKN